jgi:hypothetical protein
VKDLMTLFVVRVERRRAKAMPSIEVIGAVGLSHCGRVSVTSLCCFAPSWGRGRRIDAIS